MLSTHLTKGKKAFMLGGKQEKKKRGRMKRGCENVGELPRIPQGEKKETD